MTLISFFIVLTVFVVANGNWSQCGGSSKVDTVYCNGVDVSKGICKLQKGTNATLSVVFKAGSDTKLLKSICHGMIADVPIPFDGIEQNGCKGMMPTCPLKSGNTYTFNTKIFVRPEYPSLSLVIKWEEVDMKIQKDDWCLYIPAEIV